MFECWKSGVLLNFTCLQLVYSCGSKVNVKANDPPEPIRRLSVARLQRCWGDVTVCPRVCLVTGSALCPKVRQVSLTYRGTVAQFTDCVQLGARHGGLGRAVCPGLAPDVPWSCTGRVPVVHRTCPGLAPDVPWSSAGPPDVCLSCPGRALLVRRTCPGRPRRVLVVRRTCSGRALNVPCSCAGPTPGEDLEFRLTLSRHVLTGAVRVVRCCNTALYQL
ncbi:hypothetical protein Bbelb_358050 [Branchiostoma belcheri]|nr:hypothetical protein Bbelb_358050 [Branchiostoma belcheri]